MTRLSVGRSIGLLLFLLPGLPSPSSAQCFTVANFDVYAPGTNLHGMDGWKGIDNDPFFTAFVSSGVEPANSPPHSVIIENDANLAREATCVGESLVSVSVFQWIATPYSAGTPVEPEAGSIYRLFNTYADGGPKLAAAEIRFDPGDGMAKVLHGFGADSIEVPFDTDRWVEIQAIVDLENDWTRIYYDDQLVTEYSWTSGVLGGGGGALDIAAVDLYANGSATVFYDDLLLEPIPPFEDDFDAYANGSDIHGQGGWKGFDNDPGAGAPITEDQAHSPPRSLDVSGADRPLHELDTTFDGVWILEGWQYIPSSFVSVGPIESEAGSIFRLYNTYSDGGTQEKSAECRVDSTSANLECFQGVGSTVVVIPYDTDRWVKLQAIIDLDDDWTQIYYDDQLVTEYTWTGGILGGGSGALDIAAVDLYGNGASSVYYDDLRLDRGCGVGRMSDADGDGRSLGQELQEGTDSCQPDSQQAPGLGAPWIAALVLALLSLGARSAWWRRRH